MYEAFRERVLSAYRVALDQALPPKPRVARHWVDPSHLTWLGLLTESARFQVAWSFGQLVGVAPGLHTAGVFHLVSASFPAIDELDLAARALALVPERIDGPSRAFLVRVGCQLVLTDVAETLRRPGELRMPTAAGFEVTLPARAEALDAPAERPVVHSQAASRVRAALEHLEPAFAERIAGFCLWSPASD